MEENKKWENQALLVLSKIDEFKSDIDKIKEDNTKTKIEVIKLNDKLSYIVLIVSSIISLVWQFAVPLIVGK